MSRLINIAYKSEDRWNICSYRKKITTLELVNCSVLPGDSLWADIINDKAIEPSSGIDAAAIDELTFAYYRIPLPEIADDQLASAISLQMEAELPVDLDSVVLANSSPVSLSGANIAGVAAINARQVQSYKNYFSEQPPASFIFKSDAVKSAFDEFCDNIDSDIHAIIYVGYGQTIYCLSVQNEILDAVVYDFGYEHLVSADGTIDHTFAEQLAQGLYNSRHNYDFLDHALPVNVVSDSNPCWEELAAYISNDKIKASIAPISDYKLIVPESEGRFKPEYHAFVTAGLAEHAIHKESSLNIFDDHQDVNDSGKSKLPPLGVSAAILVVAFIFYYFISYMSSVAYLNKLNSYIDQSLGGKNLVKMQNEAKVKQLVSDSHVDILELIDKLHELAPADIKMDAISCSIGKNAVFKGSTRNPDNVDKLQQTMMKQKEFSNTWQVTRERRGKELVFAIEFGYGLFTDKKK